MPTRHAAKAAEAAEAAAVVTLVALALGTALFLLVLHRTDGDGRAEAMAFWIVWPVLVPLLLGSVALGLWFSHRLYRGAIARHP